MTKVSVMYPNTPGARFDHDYYRDKHMPLVKERMGAHCRFYSVDKGIGGGAPTNRRDTSRWATSSATRWRRTAPA